LPFEGLAILLPIGVGVMPQLTYPEESPAILIVTEGSPLVREVAGRDSNLQLMLTPRISNHFPIMDASFESHVSEGVPKDVVIFLEVDRSVVRGDLDFLGQDLSVPHERCQNHPDYVSVFITFLVDRLGLV